MILGQRNAATVIVLSVALLTVGCAFREGPPCDDTNIRDNNPSSGGATTRPAYPFGLTSGMSTAEVKSVIGEPDQVDRDSADSIEEWLYRIEPSSASYRTTAIILTFRDNSLISVKEIFPATANGHSLDDTARPDTVLGEPVPRFPWPPPQPSDRCLVPDSLVNPARDADFRDVIDRVKSAMATCGYAELTYYSAPGGCVLVTRVERINANGVPLAGDTRWRRDVGPLSLQEFDLREYFSRLLTAPVGYYRLIALVFTDQPIVSDLETILTEASADSLIARGALTLPETLLEEPYTGTHHCAALIYEFAWRDDREPPVSIRRPGSLPAHDHLSRSGILAALKGR